MRLISESIFQKFAVDNPPLYILFRRGKRSVAYSEAKYNGTAQPPLTLMRWLQQHAEALVPPVTQVGLGLPLSTYGSVRRGRCGFGVRRGLCACVCRGLQIDR